MTATTTSPPHRPHPLAAIGMSVAFVVYFVVLHALVVSRAYPVLLLALVVAPWVVAAASLLMSNPRIALPRGARIALLVVGAIGLGLAAWHLAVPLATHVDLVLYLENLAFMGMLSALFAVSLRPGRDALVTRLARIARNGDMPPDVHRYTRRLTVAWAAYFATIALVSTVLFFTQSRTLWSAFVNLAIWPLSIAMFVLEYAVRRLVLREVPHIPMMAGAHAFREHARDDARGRTS